MYRWKGMIMRSTIPVRFARPGAGGKIRLAAAIALLLLLSFSVLFLPHVARAQGARVRSAVPQADGVIYLPAIRKPVTAPVIITSLSCNKENDTVSCEGSVENVSDRTIQDIGISIYFNGKLEITTTTSINTLFAGDVSFFNASRYYPGTLSGYHAIISSWIEQ
jgi:hypothetical protein